MKITRESMAFTNALSGYVTARENALNKTLHNQEWRRYWAERARYWVKAVRGRALAQAQPGEV